MDEQYTGFLVNPKNIKLHRQYFNEMCRLLGIKVLYRAPREETKGYNGHGELETFYTEPIQVSCIYDEHPNQKTMRKLGWNAELADSSVLIHVPYDLPQIQAGALFEIPAGIDGAPNRLFKVLRMSSTAIYPASITCELGPVYEDRSEISDTIDFTKSNFNVLIDPEDN